MMTGMGSCTCGAPNLPVAAARVHPNFDIELQYVTRSGVDLLLLGGSFSHEHSLSTSKDISTERFEECFRNISSHFVSCPGF